jgi:multicomponent Na+:H+ antiporter subunit B
MLAVAFGIDSTRVWVGSKLLIGLISLGVLAFLLIGLGSVVLGGGFLEYDVYGIKDASKYGIEAVELAIGLVVSGTVTGLFFIIASGIRNNVGDTQ